MNELETPEVLPKAFDFSRFRLDDFETFTAHQFLYDNYHGSGKMYLLAVEEMSKVAKAVGFNGFKGTMAKYAQIEETAALMDAPQKETDFPGQPLPLNCGQWDCNRHGVFRIGRIGRREMACSHPIMPVERLQNVDTGETRIKLAFSREREQWRTIIVDPSNPGWDGIGSLLPQSGWHRADAFPDSTDSAVPDTASDNSYPGL